MPATNATTNYALPIFIGTDKPSWMGDWNGAMNKIDAALATAAANATAAMTTANAASTTAQAAQTGVTALETKVNSIETTLQTQAMEISENAQDIQQIQNQLPNLGGDKFTPVPLYGMNGGQVGTLYAGGNFGFISTVYTWLNSMQNAIEMSASTVSSFYLFACQGNPLSLPPSGFPFASTTCYGPLAFYNRQRTGTSDCSLGVFAFYDSANNKTIFISTNQYVGGSNFATSPAIISGYIGKAVSYTPFLDAPTIAPVYPTIPNA